MIKGAVKKVVRFYPTVKLARHVGSRNGAGATSAFPEGSFARLGEREVQVLESRYPYESPVPMAKRLRAGDACYAVRNGAEDFGAFVWIASGRSFHIPEVRADVWVPENVAYFYEAFTFPEFRGRGLMSGLLSAVVADLAESRPPDDRCEAWVARRNKPSMRSFQKAGFEPRESFISVTAGPVYLSVGRPWLREGAL